MHAYMYTCLHLLPYIIIVLAACVNILCSVPCNPQIVDGTNKRLGVYFFQGAFYLAFKWAR